MRRSRGRPGWLHVGVLEHRLTRLWAPGAFPPAESLLAVMTLAAVPRRLAGRLAEHLSGGLVVGPGAVPDLPDFEKLRALPLPQQEGTWERSAGVYDPALRRIAVGSVPSPSVNVCGHELGHALDDSDGRPSAEPWWIVLHALRRAHLAPPYQQDVTELFAESFACVLTRRTSRLIHLLGDERAARQVYAWMSDRYGIG
ncbi:hypothetical protein [Nonomuraea sp. SBT364]|uniref:hypothetical protein n=1 Tax=Nonomuraea sp. SBT364 TaxID=1580530 RepID=UPI0012E1DCE0|nr:hypothetical protein [Nonomuraea sp. SBT364]